MNKLSIQIAAFFLALGVIYIAILNVADNVTLQVWGPTVDTVAHVVNHATKNVNIALFTFVVFGIGMFVGLALFTPFYYAQEDKLRAYKRELERSSVKTDSSSSQVQVLQAKIQVLERALKEALEK